NVGSGNGTVALTATGTGSITQSSGTVRGTSVSISSPTSSLGSTSTPFKVQANQLTLNMPGSAASAYISNSSSNLILNRTTLGNTLSLLSSGAVTLNGNVSAGTNLTLTSSSLNVPSGSTLASGGSVTINTSSLNNAGTISNSALNGQISVSSNSSLSV